MPLFRKFPEIRKFQIERKNFRKNETVSLDKIIDQKGGKRFWKKGNVSKFTYQNPKGQFIPYFTVQSYTLRQLFSAS